MLVFMLRLTAANQINPQGEEEFVNIKFLLLGNQDGPSSGLARQKESHEINI